MENKNVANAMMQNIDMDKPVVNIFITIEGVKEISKTFSKSSKKLY